MQEGSSADGLIKLGKSGALPVLLSVARASVPRAVWDEAAEEGKRRMYEDAYVLERVLECGGAEVVGHEASEKAEVLRASAACFGAGERAALAVFYTRGADAILTDDRAFLGLLAEADPPVPALIPTVAIVVLAEGNRMTVEEAQEALGSIQPSVRADAYRAAMEELVHKAEGGER